jgi:large subunit ribosomal protein L9
MKVILTQDVEGRGRTGDVLDVAQGYAVNYLLPRSLAIQATKGELKQLENRRAKLEREENARLAAAEQLKEKLEAESVTIEANAGEEGKLYGSVTSANIAEAVSIQLELAIDKKDIELEEPIKELGEHKTVVRVYPGVDATLTVDVVERAEA